MRCLKYISAIFLLLMLVLLTSLAPLNARNTRLGRSKFSKPPVITLFGYRVAFNSKGIDTQSITARFGKTYVSDRFGLPTALVYRAYDHKAYVVFSYRSDDGSYAILVANDLSIAHKPPAGAYIRTIAFASPNISSSISGSAGVRLGDTPARVRGLFGVPDKRSHRGPTEHWVYITDSVVEPGEQGPRYPTDKLDLVFRKNRLTSMRGTHVEL
jgi:hypothetical protein